MHAMDWAALKRRGSDSICEGVVPSEIACTRVIESIHAGVKIAWTATKAARSSRSFRARRISINPKTTAVNTVRAVAMLASVERSTAFNLLAVAVPRKPCKHCLIEFSEAVYLDETNHPRTSVPHRLAPRIVRGERLRLARSFVEWR